MIARLALVLAACAAFLSPATAASVPLKAPGTVIYTPGGGWTTKVGAAERLAINSGQFSVGFTTQVGGKPVNMPATMRLAANAGNFAAKAFRLNPYGLLTAAVVSFLLEKTIMFDEGVWKEVSPLQNLSAYKYETFVSGSACGAMAAWAASWGASLTSCQIVSETQTITQVLIGYAQGGSRWNNVSANVLKSGSSGCPAGTVAKDGHCIGRLIQDDDPLWQNVENSPLPDSVASELAPKVPLPVQNPSFNPKHVDVPLGDPVENPVSKQLEQPKARVTPQNDGQTAEVTPYKDKVNPDGSPATDPSTGTEKPPEEESDPCKLNPDTIGCSEWGEPDNVDDLTKDKTISLTPQGGFGPDNGTCPAPLTHNLSGGRTISMSYEPVCRAAGMFRPAVIGMAWLSALLLMFGIQRQAQS